MIEAIAYNLLSVEKLDKIFKMENIVLQIEKKFEYPVTNLKLFLDEVNKNIK